MSTPDMFSHGHNPDDPELRAAYDALEPESPPAAIDVRIRAHARAALARPGRRWYMPAALAATVLLSFGLVTQITNAPVPATGISETVPEVVDEAVPAALPSGRAERSIAAESHEESAAPPAAPVSQPPRARSAPPARTEAPAVGGSDAPAVARDLSAPAAGFASDPDDTKASSDRLAKAPPEAFASTTARDRRAVPLAGKRMQAAEARMDTDAGLHVVHTDAESGCVWLEGGDPMSPRALAERLRGMTVSGLVAATADDATHPPAAATAAQIARAAGTRYYRYADNGRLIVQPAGDAQPLSDHCDPPGQ